MAIDRFYLPNLNSLELSGDEAKHCVQVLRHEPGERVTVFDGKGTEITAEIVRANKKKVFLKEISRRTFPCFPWELSLVQAIPKGKQMDWITRKATELGASAVYPVISERTVVQVGEDRAETKHAKWQQGIVEAAKQCGQNHMPVLHHVQTLDNFFAQPPKADIFFYGSLEPDADTMRSVFDQFRIGRDTPPSRVTVLIGPEGDLSPSEWGKARALGFAPVTLGDIILRSETAAIFALSVISYELQNLWRVK